MFVIYLYLKTDKAREPAQGQEPRAQSDAVELHQAAKLIIPNILTCASVVLSPCPAEHSTTLKCPKSGQRHGSLG